MSPLLLLVVLGLLLLPAWWQLWCWCWCWCSTGRRRVRLLGVVVPKADLLLPLLLLLLFKSLRSSLLALRPRVHCLIPPRPPVLLLPHSFLIPPFLLLFLLLLLSLLL
jgi:hypothetical protein